MTRTGSLALCLALSLGIALGLWMGTNADTGPITWQTCAMLGLLAFGFLQVCDLLAAALVRALRGPRGEVSDG